MFVHYETLVRVPLGVVEQRLNAINDDLDEWAGIAYRKGESLRARVGPHVDGLAKEVRLEIGAHEIHRKGLVYPIRWVATGASSLFPTMTADLVLSHVGLTQTKLTFEGTYEPPMGPLGKMIDRIAFRKLADATVKTWVDRIAQALDAESVN
ncbi:MAG: hypothetical protein WD895_00040 [Acidimicrobiia bacterium]